jgi:hypothetical protein
MRYSYHPGGTAQRGPVQPFEREEHMTGQNEGCSMRQPRRKCRQNVISCDVSVDDIYSIFANQTGETHRRRQVDGVSHPHVEYVRGGQGIEM